MSYRSSIEIAALISVAVHIAGISAIGFRMQHVPEPPPERTTIIIALRPPDPPEEKQVKYLVESAVPAERPVEETDLISDQDTQGRDNSPEEGEGPQPTSERESDFDELGAPEPSLALEPIPLVPVAAAPPPAVSEPPEPEPEAEAAPPTQDSPERATVARAEEEVPLPSVAQPATEPAVAEAEAEPDPESEAEPEPEPEAETLPEPFEVAQAQIPPQPMMEDITATRTRKSGGAKDKGAISFEANKHIFGEYMLGVRRIIRGEWLRGLKMRYTGAGPAEAVIKFSISPKGEVVYATILDRGVSITYAAMCKGAIEKAGPFPAFPFDLPAEYRSRNLELEIRFRYM